MKKKAHLVLEDGSVYKGYSFGAEVESCGEVVFNTSMTGYQEMLTDPSYAGQIVTLTYPLIGNYGINEDDIESKRIQVSGFVIREDCHIPSHWQSKKTISEYLKSYGIPGISGVDTRSLTRKLRSVGVMMGAIMYEKSPAEALVLLRSIPRYDDVDFVREVTAECLYEWNMPHVKTPAAKHHIVAIDCGLKFNILRTLHGLGCRVTVVPCTSSARDVLSLKPNGVLLSPGPGDPALLGYMEETVKGLIGRTPIMGICLGNQLIGRAFGAKTFKLKFGHRGANHPVRDLTTGRVYITAQNHGFAVDADTVKNGLEVSHINLNDNTVEGLQHKELPIFSIQYHSEGSPGPMDNMYLFEKFVDMVKKSSG